MTIHAWAAHSAGATLQPFEYDPGPLGPDAVEIQVEHCGICHSDLSMLDNEWQMAKYPYVGGHEAIGRIVALGENAKGLKIGQRVGLGWNSGCCMHCRECLAGNHHLCPKAQGTIVGHYGAFADRVRAEWQWAIPIPEALDASAAGPLLCGGITVFAPLVEFDVKPIHRAGVIGIGGLGHMALMFLRAWGCEVTAFTSSASKQNEARRLGAHHVVGTHDRSTIGNMKGSLDLLLVTANVTLDWPELLDTLAPNGRLHVVGAVLEPIPVPAFKLIGAQRNVSGSPTGSPSVIGAMLDFAARHKIAPIVEHFPMNRINDALDHLRAGKPRYRIVLDN